MRYIPHTEADVARMLATIGVPDVEALFRSIPERDRFSGALPLPPALDEAQLLGHLTELAQRNAAPAQPGGPRVFLGAGSYRHTVPAVLDQIVLRAEFLTAYTPYQPEISQGTLQSIFEYQTMVCELLGLDVANASMYDGASATAEALLMARRVTRRDALFVSDALHPEYQATCDTYLSGLARPPLVRVPLGPDGRTDPEALRAALEAAAGDADKRARPAAVAIQSPNFLGVVEDVAALAEVAHAYDALLVVAVAEPVSLGLLEAPGHLGADVAVGEGVGYAVPLSLGGPGVGLFATREAYKRQMPGRLVGETVDRNGVRGYVLTLATREQHIRREKATSNICTNQGLVALCFAIQSALLGRRGFGELARLNFHKAQYALGALTDLPGFARPFSGPVFNEFVLRVPGGDADALVARLSRQSPSIVPGVGLGRFRPEWRDLLLVCVTELHRRQDIDQLASALQGAAQEA